MKTSVLCCCMLMLCALASSAPATKNDVTDDLSPLNERKKPKQIRTTTTEESIPEFDRTKVSLDVPPPIIGGGFTLITNISKVLSSLITNSAKRTERVLEVFKPLFRGIFAIKGLPSDNEIK